MRGSLLALALGLFVLGTISPASGSDGSVRFKKFLFEDFEKLYTHTEFKKVPGKSPVMTFYNEQGDLTETLDIAEMKRDQLNQIMLEHGFQTKGQAKAKDANAHDEV
ncbi:hypothetical protein TCAL_05153 [Tigriopus californicus]|uniref:Selenoprotein F/M domain-containing protein n=1 Tax=Tigriopus californicus TaxID=6832 RepID=A0A553NNS1_TIGCA|nr:hypothetical protein TCAL_05153 [Tigriopus californicus]|eukprot:TCALIF_05153-PA protein Name:"Similar to sepm Selenoprotein M (Xenopus laevis)" AED:0.08 eAED:0.08 QI:0/0/0/1/1/1/2/0/106